MKREYTATLYILQDDKVLLIKHKKFGLWLPPGGHLEPDELPSNGALREAKEETGLEITLIQQENIWFSPQPNGRSIERPYLCLLENIPATPKEEAHQHIDFIFVGYPTGGSLVQNQDETDGIRWFAIDQINDLETFAEVKATIRYLIDNIPSPCCQASAQK